MGTKIAWNLVNLTRIAAASLIFVSIFAACSKKNRSKSQNLDLIEASSISYIRDQTRARLSFHSNAPSSCKIEYQEEGSTLAPLVGECSSSDERRFFVLFTNLKPDAFYSFKIYLKSPSSEQSSTFKEKDLVPIGSHYFESVYHHNTHMFHIGHVKLDGGFSHSQKGCDPKAKTVHSIFKPIFKLSGYSHSSREGPGWTQLYGFHPSKDWKAHLSDGWQTVSIDLDQPTHPSNIKLNNFDIIDTANSRSILETSNSLQVEWQNTSDQDSKALLIAIRQGDFQSQCYYHEKSFAIDLSQLQSGPFHLHVSTIKRKEYYFYDQNFEPWVHNEIHTIDLLAIRKSS